MSAQSTQTNEWQLKGATYQANQTFHYVGDYNEDQRWFLNFNVNGVIKLINIPEPLKAIANTYDEIINGVVHYNTKIFTVTHTTVLFLDASWIQDKETVICYCYMPYDVQSNTPILCDKLDVISGMITKINICGVKVINKVLAIRLPRTLLEVSQEADKETILRQFNSYLRENPLTIIYCLAQSDSQLLEDYSFDIQPANNTITCNTQYPPNYFNVTYPLDVIINTTVDVKEVQALVSEVRETKQTIDAIQGDLSQKSETVGENYQTIQGLYQKIEGYETSINEMHQTITTSQEEVAASLETVQTLKSEIETWGEETKQNAGQVKQAVQSHNEAQDSHQDIRQSLIAHNEAADSHQEMRQLLKALEQQWAALDFDFGSYVETAENE